MSISKQVAYRWVGPKDRDTRDKTWRAIAWSDGQILARVRVSNSYSDDFSEYSVEIPSDYSTARPCYDNQLSAQREVERLIGAPRDPMAPK